MQRRQSRNQQRKKTAVNSKASRSSRQVRVWEDKLALPSYMPAPPDKNPMFLEKRVYQGSSGRVYPLPFTDRIAQKPTNREWKAVWLENRYLKVLILPELGGRIHAIQDKTNGEDMIYNQPVIKPALVGLAGPWISGGIEFNWPQHHRPATFLPVDTHIEKHTDGSVTVWCSDHDPMQRMKGMHGVCLHPERAILELKVRAYNRTPYVQTFLWWANVATRVHEAYQSFFPPDVHYVADHAKRALSRFPLCDGHYYGVNYAERGRRGVPPAEVPRQFVPPHCRGQRTGRQTGSQPPDYRPDDLSFYANIPVPTSYMCMGSKEHFFGGYDYKSRTGIVHIANRHISPGKKQWTWGNHEFGYAWDRNLTDPDDEGVHRPYIELMAGVYTDNQPDFSFLQPGETKTWSQYWYPLREIGPAQRANLDAAVSLRVARKTARGPGTATIGVAVTAPSRSAEIRLSVATSKTGARRRRLATFKANLAPARPFTAEVKLPRGAKQRDLHLCVLDSSGRELVSHQPREVTDTEVPPAATEPPSPADIASTDELFITGLHLEQYRHATRSPEPYWREALRRDPLDSRCNNALGLWHLRRGELDPAEAHFRHAVERLTRRNPNPHDGEPLYNLGLCLRLQLLSVQGSITADARFEHAYEAFYKATWNQAWAAAGHHALAEMDCVREDWNAALEHLNRSLRFNTDNTRARDLKVVVLRQLGRDSEADRVLRETLALDPLDWWAHDLARHNLSCDLQARLDLAHDYTRAGLYQDATRLLRMPKPAARDLPDQSWGAWPMLLYTLAWLQERCGKSRQADATRQRAAKAAPDHCFPARVEEIAILEEAIRANPNDARAPYYLGNLLYDRRRHKEAIRHWQRSAKLDPSFAVVWRNLGLGLFNVAQKPQRARAAYQKAFKAAPGDARVLYERDQLWKRLSEHPARRLRELEKHLDLVRQRDDLSLELCELYNQTGQHDRALALLRSRKFQPWEGGEGGPLGQHVRSHLALGRQALTAGHPEAARDHFQAALSAPDNLAEARHLLANPSDVHYWLGCAFAALGDRKQARGYWRAAATFKGDFQEMSLNPFSEMTYYSALACVRLGHSSRATQLLKDLLGHARRMESEPAEIDYFATSLPTMLLFDQDLQHRKTTTALFLQAQAHLALGNRAKGRQLLKRVLERDPNHALASDLLAEQTA